jgi:hypothetical protein
LSKPAPSKTNRNRISGRYALKTGGLAVLATAGLLSCSTDDPISPRPVIEGRSAALATGSASLGPGSPGPFDLPVYPYPTLVLLVISGTVRVDYPPNTDGSPRPGHVADYRGVAASWSCFEGLSLWSNNGWDAIVGGGCPTYQYAGTEPLYSTYVYTWETPREPRGPE